MPHRQHVEAAAELQPLGLRREPQAELDQVGEDLVALALEMMLGGPQHVEAELVHGLRHVARGEERLAQPLVRIAPLVRRRAVEADIVELDLADIEHVEFVDHRVSTHISVMRQACFKTRRVATSALHPSGFHARIHAPSGRGPQGGRRLAQGQAGRARHAAAVPPVRLCGHRQDHARAPSRGADRRRGEVRGLHRQGRAGDAPQGLRRRDHDPQPDLPRARERRGDADLRAVGRRAGLEGEADRDRRVLDGRCRARARPDVVRRAGAGAGRSGAAAAGRRAAASSPRSSRTRC